MTIDVDELEGLAGRADLLEQEIRMTAEGNPIVIHAANSIAMAATGIRKAITKEGERLARAAAFSELRTREAIRREDPLTADLAEKRGISYDEMAKIRNEAAGRAAQAARAGSIPDQLERLAPK